MDLDKARIYLYRAFQDMRRAVDILSEEGRPDLKSFLTCATLIVAAKRLARFAEGSALILRDIIPKLIEQLKKEAESFHFNMRKDEKQGWDEMMLEIFQNSNLPLCIGNLPPKRDGGWYTNDEYYRAAEILRSTNTPPLGVRLEMWQFDKLKEVFGPKRAKRLYLDIITLDPLITENDLQEMTSILHRIHPDDQEKFAGYIDETRQKLKAEKDEIQFHVRGASIAQITALLLSLAWLYSLYMTDSFV